MSTDVEEIRPRYSTIARIQQSFPIGPQPPPEQCPQDCGDPWGEHVVILPGAMSEGGTTECPVEGCGCVGTWAIDAWVADGVPPHAFYLDDRNGRCFVCGDPDYAHPEATER